jgi:hypothetical protein
MVSAVKGTTIWKYGTLTLYLKSGTISSQRANPFIGKIDKVRGIRYLKRKIDIRWIRLKNVADKR